MSVTTFSDRNNRPKDIFNLIKDKKMSGSWNLKR